MMWLIIILVIAIPVILFLISLKKFGEKIKIQGGMQNKFNKLITLIQESDNRFRIVKEGSTYIMLGYTVLGVSTLVELTAAFHTLQVVYKVALNVGEKAYKVIDTLNWEFPIDMDQEHMFFDINQDLGSRIKKYIQ